MRAATRSKLGLTRRASCAIGPARNFLRCSAEPEAVAVLVTRPFPDNEMTAAALREQGFDVLLAPMLRFDSGGVRAMTVRHDNDGDGLSPAPMRGERV